MGFLVECLSERGIETEGVDISEYAIGQAHESGAREMPGRQRYRALWTQVFAHHLYRGLGAYAGGGSAAAIANLCAHSDDILFSSSPEDHRELTHLNVRPAEYWAGLFAQQGFYRDLEFEASFLTPWALRFRKGDPGPQASRLVQSYERRLHWLQAENEGRREIAREMRSELSAKNAEIEAREAQISVLDEQISEMELRHYRPATGC